MVNEETGQVVPARCGRNRCGYCLPLNAMRRARAIAWMNPRRTLTLTNLAPADDPDPWQTVRKTVNRTREYLKRSGVDPGYWGTFVERGSKTGMIHAHVVQHGPAKVPMGELQNAAHRAGAGWTRVESIRVTKDLSRYVGKGFGIASYVGKTFDHDDGEPEEALRLNGGRIGHFSRGFFQSPDGGKLPVREAEKQAARAARDGDTGRWVLVRSALALSALSPA